MNKTSWLLMGILMGLGLAACNPLPCSETRDLGEVTMDMAFMSDMTSADMTPPVPMGGLQITNTSAGRSAPGISVKAGAKHFLMGQFLVLGQGSEKAVRSIPFSVLASDPTNCSNFSLEDGAGHPLATVAAVSAGKVVFDLTAKPLMFKNGQVIALNIFGNVDDGVNRSYQLEISADTDIDAVDTTSGKVVVPTLNMVSCPLQLSYLGIDSALSALPSSDAPSGDISADGSLQKLASWDVRIDGEQGRLSSFQGNLVLSGIASSSVTDFQVVDEHGGLIGMVIPVIPTSDPRETFAGNVILPDHGVTKLIVLARLKSGTMGKVQAVFNNVAVQGFTSLKSFSALTLTGNELTVK